jgi:UV DNA damage endonuclease
MIRFGLCCIFKKEPIRFRRTTAKHVQKFPRAHQLRLISELCLQNAASLLQTLKFCHLNGIKDFRVNSQILPLKTHPDLGYVIDDLPNSQQIVQTFEACGRFCRQNDIRTTLHPDQFILLSSPNGDVISRSKSELSYQTQVSQWIHADVINIHAGGAYGEKKKTLHRLAKQIETLSDEIRNRLTLENDDRVYAPADLLPLCNSMAVPLVYDVHHHRCLPDGVSIEKTTELAIKTWNREPLFHLSTPITSKNPSTFRQHHDYIDPRDLPEKWLSLNITIEVEAKAKELAVIRLMKHLKRKSKLLEKGLEVVEQKH